MPHSCASEGLRGTPTGTGGVAVSRAPGAAGRGAAGGEAAGGDGAAGHLSVRDRREALLASAATTTFSSPTVSSVADEKYNVLETGKTPARAAVSGAAAPGTFQLPKLRSTASPAGAAGQT